MDFKESYKTFEEHLKSLKKELEIRKKEMASLGKKAWKPHKRNRTVSLALQAYALLASSASDGAVRQIEGIIDDE